MGCNPDILENIVQRAGGPRDIYFPIYPDYNPCTNIIHRVKPRRGVTEEVPAVGFCLGSGCLAVITLIKDCYKI